MRNELSNPLQKLIGAAGKTLATSTGETAKVRQRFAGTSDKTVLLCDTSGSMDGRAGSKRQIDHLQEALQSILPQLGSPIVIAFDATVRVVSPYALPSPSGGTNLAAGIRLAIPERPSRTIILSDGQPDDPEAALAAAAELSGRIDVVFCGPDSDKEGLAFMRRLARAGFGQCQTHNWRSGPCLAFRMRGLLALPAPGGG